MPYMVAPIGRKPIQTPPPPKPEEKKVASDAEQLTQLLGDIGKKLETAWNNAINPPPGAAQQDPLLRFLSEFTNTPLAKVETPPAQTAKADAQKIAERQTQKKDSLGFSVSEPEPAPVQKKDETPVEPQKPGEIAKPTKAFDETAARIYAAREDGIATKAEAGALIYTMAQEIKLAKAAGIPQDEISKTMSRMFGEFRIGVALSDDLLKESESIGGQVAVISMMGDNPDAYEKLGLSLLGGKPPEPVKVPPPPEIIIPGSNMQQGGGNEGGFQFAMGANGQPVSIEQQYQKVHPNQQGQNQTANDTRQRQDQLRRTEERRREDLENADKGGGGGGGGANLQVEQQQQLSRMDQLRQQQDQQRLQDSLRQMEDQQRRDEQNRNRR